MNYSIRILVSPLSQGRASVPLAPQVLVQPHVAVHGGTVRPAHLAQCVQSVHEAPASTLMRILVIVPTAQERGSAGRTAVRYLYMSVTAN